MEMSPFVVLNQRTHFPVLSEKFFRSKERGLRFCSKRSFHYSTDRMNRGVTILSHGRFLSLPFNGDFSAVFLSIGEEKMSPLSKKRGHHDLRILRFERTASTAAVRTHGNFGSIPSPLHLAYSPMLRRYPIMNHSVLGACFLHELQIKTVQHGADGNAEQHP